MLTPISSLAKTKVWGTVYNLASVYRVSLQGKATISPAKISLYFPQIAVFDLYFRTDRPAQIQNTLLTL